MNKFNKLVVSLWPQYKPINLIKNYKNEKESQRGHSIVH